MDPNLLNLDVNPCSPWQAIDLGVKLAKVHYIKLLIIWCSIATPILFISGLVLFNRPSSWAFVIWWLKPVMEQGMLVYLSREIFQQPTNHKTIIHSLLNAKSGLIGSLTYRRLSPNRSTLMPVAVLEQQHFLIASKRRGQLRLKLGSSATWLTLVIMHLEFIFVFGFVASTFLVLPDHFSNRLIDEIYNISPTVITTFTLLWFISIGAIAPLYTSSGFCLYLNARARTEGWDLELNFKQIGLALEHARSILLVSFIIFAWVIPINEVSAMTPVQAQEAINELRAQPPLGKKINYKELDPHQHKKDRKKDREKEKSKLSEWLENVALVIEVFAWVLVATLIYLIIKFMWHNRHTIRGYFFRKSKRPSQIITSWSPTSPSISTENRLERAQRLLKAGATRPALSELTIVTLLALKNKGITVKVSSTTNDICNQLTGNQEQWALLANQILNQWISCAWGHQDDIQVPAIQVWIDQWQQYFSHSNLVDTLS